MARSFFDYRRLRPWLWRWHRRVGLTAAGILLLVTGTGIFLNHTSELSLAEIPVGQSWLLSFYGIPQPEIITFDLTGEALSGDENGQLYRGDKTIAVCRGKLVGAVTYEAGFVAACEQELLIFDAHGGLSEKFGALYGLPTPVAQLGECGGKLCIRTSKRLFQVNIEQLSFPPLVWSEPLWSRQVELPEVHLQAIYKASRGEGLSWERVLLDFHSGRLFGNAGVWVVDIAAVMLLFLSLSGFVLWYQHFRIRHNR